MSSRRRHDVYDDTPYGAYGGHGRRREHYASSRRGRRRSSEARQQQEDAYNRGLYYPQPGDRGIMERTYPPAQMAPAAPAPSMFDSFFAPAWDVQPHAGHAGVFGDGLFGMMRGMMSSMDRMFDEMAASTMDNHGGGGGGGGGNTFYYESKTRTVGPDGIVREETVRTVPGADGRPETRRTVREGESAPGMGRFRADAHEMYDSQDAMPRVMNDGYPGYPGVQAAPEPDVVIEELDEQGNVVASSDAASGVPYDGDYAPYGQNADETQPRSWWHRRYRQ